MQTIAYLADQLGRSFNFLMMFDLILLLSALYAFKITAKGRGSGNYFAIIPLGMISFSIFLMQIALFLFNILWRKDGNWILIVLFAYMIYFLFMLLSAVMMFFGWMISIKRPNWIREIEYIYTIVSSVSLLKLLVSRAAMSISDDFELIAIFGLSFAVALKLAKVEAEIKRYDLPPEMRPGYKPRTLR